jgi:7-carboxy-7-deazaguanine synthase
MQNLQAPMPRDAEASGRLLVNDIFKTIQGEGPFSGCRATFVRLGGCNLQCPGCDTEYTAGNSWKPYEEICAAIGTGIELVVLTGGEPFRQNVGELLFKIIENGVARHVQIETNGTMPPDAKTIRLVDAGLVSIVCSPKMSHVNDKIAAHAIAWKYVMSTTSVDPDDGLPVLALGHGSKAVARPPLGFPVSRIYLQPEDESIVGPDAMFQGISNQEASALRNKSNLAACVASCLKHGYRLCLQVHKYADLD